jgi:geranylgeranyl pyrophosphate synthase
MSVFEDLSELSSGFLSDVYSVMRTEACGGFNTDRTIELLNYQTDTKGHMLRPLLVHLISCGISKQISGETSKQLIAFAASLELMHNASLVHDDLIDRETYRRGKLCLHEVYGFRSALLCGNILYIKSIGLCSKKVGSLQTSELLQTAALMCDGEIMQAQLACQPLSRDSYYEIIRKKTACLISLACRQTAQLMGVSPGLVQTYSDLGEQLGILYQLRDDDQDRDTQLQDDFDFQEERNINYRRILRIMESLPKEHDLTHFERFVPYFSN